MNEQRRQLNFTDLDQVTEDARRLLTAGYQSRGNWDLGQVCAHLNDWMRFPMDGYPPAPLPVRFILWVIKVTFGRRQLKTVLSNGFRDSLPTMPATVHAADEQPDAAAVEQLAATIERFKTFDGPFHASPIYGDLTPEAHRQLQLAALRPSFEFPDRLTPSRQRCARASGLPITPIVLRSAAPMQAKNGRLILHWRAYLNPATV